MVRAHALVRDRFRQRRCGHFDISWCSGHYSYLDYLLLFGHRSFIRNERQTAVICVVSVRILYRELGVSYARQSAFLILKISLYII